MDLVTPTIPEFYSGKNIFITGATGFLGKALIEKFLRCCPDIGNIYILIRCKRGKSLLERLKDLIDDSVFLRLKSERPSLKMDEKLIPFAGNIKELNLGLNDEDRQIITDNVNIIFHCAASIRFNDSLTDAVLINIRGTREICQLALECKNIIAFMHVSTAYSNCDLFEIKEELYPAKADWKKLIKTAEACDQYILSAVTQIYMNHMSNTYVFTKQIAETVAYDMMIGKIPTKIFRPSVVVSAFKEPMKGWIDNFNGPVGLITAYGKGLMRTGCTADETIIDYIPVDIVTKSLIVSNWDLAVQQNKNEIEVMHCANNTKAEWLNLKVKYLMKYGTKIANERLPLNNIIWSISNHYTSNRHIFYIETLLYMLLPFTFLDALIKLSGRKPILKKLVLKTYNTTTALLYFSLNNWNLHNDKLFELLKKVKPEDKADWDYDFMDYDMETYLYYCIEGSRRYLLHEPDDTIPQAKVHFRRMLLVEKIFWTVIYILIGYFVWDTFFKYFGL